MMLEIQVLWQSLNLLKGSQPFPLDNLDLQIYTID